MKERSKIDKRLTKIVGLCKKNQHYDLPGEAVGHEFVSLLTDVVTLLSRVSKVRAPDCVHEWYAAARCHDP